MHRESWTEKESTELFLSVFFRSASKSMAPSIYPKHLQRKTATLDIFYRFLFVKSVFIAAEDAWITDSATSAGSMLKPQVKREISSAPALTNPSPVSTGETCFHDPTVTGKM
jgi:hypothetical protein